MNVLDATGHAYMKRVHIGQLKDFTVMNAKKKISYIGGMVSSCAQDVQRQDLKGLKKMTDKNKKKEEAKKQRNLWPMSPVTRIVESRKKYNRQKDRKNKKLYD